jgi:hypothetical protein
MHDLDGWPIGDGQGRGSVRLRQPIGNEAGVPGAGLGERRIGLPLETSFGDEGRFPVSDEDKDPIERVRDEGPRDCG